MDADTLTQAAIGAGIIAAGVWNGIETWRTKHLARELVRPVQETHRQVSVNKHVSDPPTLLDKVDAVQLEQTRVRAELKAAGLMFDGHMSASADDRAELWRHIFRLEHEVGIPTTPTDPDERRADEQPDL